MTTKRSRTRTLIDIAPKDKRRLPKPLKGFADFAARLVALFKANKQALSTDGLDLDQLLADIRTYQELADPEVAAQQQLTKISNTRLVLGSSSWLTMLELYARAVVAGRTNAAILAQVADFAEFLRHARKHRAKKASGASTTPATVATPAVTTGAG